MIVLAACGFARSIEHLLTDKRSRGAIETAERFADGLAIAEEVDRVSKAAWAVLLEEAWTPARAIASAAAEAAWKAARAAGWAAIEATWTAAREAAWTAEAATKAAEASAKAVNQSILDCILPPRIQVPFPAHVKGLASTIYETRDWLLMPILADALEESGQTAMAAHCRGPIHAKGCWVLDSIMGLG